MNLSLFRPTFLRWWLASLCLVALRAETTPLDSVEKSAGEWLKVRAESSRLETEWNTQRQLLDSIVHGLDERAQSLEVKRDYLRAKTAKDRDDLAKLAAANQTTSAGLRTVEEQLIALSPKLLQLRSSLPPRLSTALELSYKSLAAPDLSLSQRMQLTMTILNRCQQFNRSIICEEEILQLGGDGAERQLEVIYWGLSHGYALDRPKGQVWYGSPGSEHWQWEQIPDAAARVAKLMAVYRGKAEPEFIEVPIRLKAQTLVTSKK